MRKAHGFTMIELIMVIILVGIIAVYAAPRFNRDTFDLRSASGEVVSALRYAQTMAMQHSGLANVDGGGRDYYTFQVANNGYTVAIGDSDSTHVDVPNPVGGAGSYSQSWSAGSVGLTASTANIYFTSKGEPIDASGNPLAADTTLSISVGSESDTIIVERLTGYVHR